jgi:serine/threonine protein phosphatase PrpC
MLRMKCRVPPLFVFPDRFHTIQISCAAEENDKGQDQPFYGKTPSRKLYFGVWDGHGTNTVITELRNYITTDKLSEFMDSSYPINVISDDLLHKKLCKERESSGATMNFGVLDGNILTCTNCGDSRMFVFRNGSLVYTSIDHSWENKKERDRLGESVLFWPSNGIKIIDDKHLLETYSEYMIQKNGNRLAMTQSIGHNSIMDLDPDTFRLEIQPTDEIVAVSVSDGVTDMLICDEAGNVSETDINMIYMLSVEDLKNKIQARWLQPWDMIYLTGEKIPSCSFKKTECDDIGITRLVMRPKPQVN